MTAAEHAKAARSYHRYGMTLRAAGYPERARFWAGMAKDCMKDARIARAGGAA